MAKKPASGTGGPGDSENGFHPFVADSDLSESIDFDRFLLPIEVTTSGSTDLRSLKLAEYGKLLQAIPIPIFFVDCAASSVFGNKAVEKYLEESQGGRITTFNALFPDPREAYLAAQALRDVFADRKARQLEGLLEIAGHKLWGRVHLRSIRVREKQLILALVEDLTAERKRLILNEKYRKLYNLLPIGIVEFALVQPVSTDTPLSEALAMIMEARAVEGNVEFARIRGLNGTEDLMGATLEEFLPYERDNKALFRTWINRKFAISSAETRCSRNDSSVRYLENILIGIVSNERLLGFWLATRDVTERQGLNEERLKAQKMESVGILAGGIAHDFNNFLTVILGSISLVKMEADSEGRVYRLLSDAEQGAQRAKELTSQLLTFSKGGEPIKKVASFAPLIEDWVAFALRGSNVTYDFSIDSDLWLVEIDEGQVCQVINNIAINAAQAMAEGGRLHVSANNVVVGSDTGVALDDGKYVRVSLQDTGPGIVEEHLHRVFDPYFTTKPHGTGLGLATSYSIIKGHCGTICVESQPKTGTTFHIFLPASEKCLAEGVPAEEVVLRGSGRILIMDDVEMVRRTAYRLLHRMGYEVDTARDGDEAIEFCELAVAKGTPYHAIIVDLTVPGAPGAREVVGELRKIDPTARVIVSSGYATDPVMSRYREFGFDGVVTKPYNAEELHRVLDAVIAQRPR